MERRISIIGAKNSAQVELEKNALLSLPVDIDALAEKNGIAIDVMPSDLAKRSLYGAFLAVNNTVTILYSTLIDNLGFQRFTIAHELGHYFLDGHIDAVVDTSGLHISESDFCSKSVYEVEADHFAAGLLMPEKLCKRLIGGYPDGLEGIRALAKETWSSLTAAAIRYIDLTTAASAVVVSSAGKIEYTICTRELTRIGSIPYRGTNLPSGSLSAKLSGADRQIAITDSGELDSDLSLWVGGRTSVPCTEQVVVLGRTGKILTVLTCSELADEDEERDNDEDFQGHWGLKFR